MAVTFDTGPGGQLLCAFIEALMEAVETTFTPELLPEEQYLDDEISMYPKISSLEWIAIW